MKDHSLFLQSVSNYIAKNPEAAAYVSDFVAKGLIQSQREILERAADMEVALSVSIAKRYNKRDELIRPIPKTDFTGDL